jgi:arylsulfatase A-like enzyme
MRKRVVRFCLSCSVMAIGCARPTEVHTPPNIVLITIDALRADALSFAGHVNQTSPNLDAFTSESVVFRQAMTSYPGTAPAMPSLMTGLYPSFEGVDAWSRASRHGFNDFESPGERDRSGLTNNLRMLAEILDEAGYATIGFNTNPNLSKNENFNQGFDEYHQFEVYLESVRKNRTHRLVGNYPPADVVVDEVVGRLQTGFDGPAFLWIHLMEPHSPYLPPARFARLFAGPESGFSDLEINESLYQVLYTQQGSLRAAKRYPSPEERGLDRSVFRDRLWGLYEGEIRFCDEQIQRLFDALHQHTLWDNTLIMVTADHGEEFFDHDHVVHHDLTGLAEELIHIPLILKLPSGRPRGLSIGELVRMVDFAPTILDYAGLANESTAMDGTSLRPLIEGRSTPPRVAYFSTITLGIVRDARWKYRLEKKPAAKGPGIERLYDIVADPMEEHDVAEMHPEVVEKMRRQYQLFALGLAARKPPNDGALISTHDGADREELEQLEALGYVSD